MPVIDSSFNSSDPKTIAEQVRKDAIAKENLATTAKVTQIERVGREIWMYNPVPYWKITIADQRQTLVYFTTQDGKFRALMQRNGQPTHQTGQPAKEIAPPELINATIRKAREWGLPARAFPQTRSEKANWASGCENVSAPYPCDPILRQGWKITVSHQQSRWVFRGERAENLELIERTSATEKRLPASVRGEIKRIAGNHFQLSPFTVLITKVEPQTFSDSCLGLGNLAETCLQQTVQGYRVTAIGKINQEPIFGKTNQQQIYRISNDAKLLRTEAIAGLPVRTDELPTLIAFQIFQTARTDLKQSIENLNITEVEKTFDCFRSPTAPPNTPCSPIKRMNGWKVTVTNYQQRITYIINLNGIILSKKLF